MSRMVVAISLAALSAACNSSGRAKAERIALQKEAETIEARHHMLDEEIAGWSENVGRWMKANDVSLDPARVVLALSSRSYFLHESQHAHSGDADYSRLEDQMQEIQEKRRLIERDWLALRVRDRASLTLMGGKPKETQLDFAFQQGDSTIPIPGVSERQRCCPLTTGSLDGTITGCKLTSESCAKDATKKGWHLVCKYECDPIVLTQ